MPIRETSKEVAISGRRWKIGKFDALTGSYIALKMMSKLSGVIVEIFSGKLDMKLQENQAMVAMGVAQEVGNLTKPEFMEIQTECLRVVKEIKTVGDKDIETPAYLPGRWGVEDLENNPLLVMTLVFSTKAH